MNDGQVFQEHRPDVRAIVVKSMCKDDEAFRYHDGTTLAPQISFFIGLTGFDRLAQALGANSSSICRVIAEVLVPHPRDL